MFHRILPGYVPALALALSLFGCGPTGSYDISGVSLPLTVTTPQAVAVSVVDLRPYVVDGGESATFLGTERGNWGGEKAMGTASGEPVATELTGTITNALRARGVAATALPLKRGTTDDAALAAFRAQNADRLLVVRLGEWRTDIYTRVTLKWYIQAAVYDRDGNLLGQRTNQGISPVGDTGLDRDYTKIAVNELSMRLGNLLNDPVITSALK